MRAILVLHGFVGGAVAIKALRESAVARGSEERAGGGDDNAAVRLAAVAAAETQWGDFEEGAGPAPDGWSTAGAGAELNVSAHA